MTPTRYGIIQKFKGASYGGELYAENETEAKKLAKLIGAKFDGEILEEELVCEDCLQPITCLECEDLNEMTAFIPEANN